jgi:2-dehydropantoate 2-reductase
MSRAASLLVVGGGGIGGVLAGHLVQGGHQVTILSPNLGIASALETRGLRVEGKSRLGPVQVRVARSASDLRGPYDAALLATQPPQVEEAAAEVLPFLGPSAPLVCFQNGLCEERLGPRFGAERVYGAVVAWGASQREPGIYERTSAGGFVLGRLDGQVDRTLEELGSWLRTVGPTTLTSNLVGARWSKLAFNCAVSSLGTLGGERLGPLLRRRFVRRLALELMSEVVSVAQASGVRLEKLSGTLDLLWLSLSPAERLGQDRLRLGLKHALLLAVGARYRRLRSSMLAALERGRPVPIDFLNGEVVSRAQVLGVPTPVNAAVCAALREVEAGRGRPGLGALETLYASWREARG